MRILDIIEATTVDGPGFRVSVYFAGCAHGCPGCHNPQSHDFAGGYEITPRELADRLLATGLDVSLSGGDPAYQADEVIELADILHSQGRTIWLYTGFTYEELLASAELRPLIEAVDVIVDGPFIMAQRDTNLLFRGSANQRLIDTAKTLACGEVTLWSSSF